MQKDHIYAGYNLLHSTMVNQKQKGQSDGGDSDWTLRHRNLPCFPHFIIFFDHFRRPVVFKHFPNLSYLVGVHNPLKSFSKTTQIQLI